MSDKLFDLYLALTKQQVEAISTAWDLKAAIEHAKMDKFRHLLANLEVDTQPVTDIKYTLDGITYHLRWNPKELLSEDGYALPQSEPDTPETISASSDYAVFINVLGYNERAVASLEDIAQYLFDVNWFMNRMPEFEITGGTMDFQTVHNERIRTIYSDEDRDNKEQEVVTNIFLLRSGLTVLAVGKRIQRDAAMVFNARMALWTRDWHCQVVTLK